MKEKIIEYELIKKDFKISFLNILNDDNKFKMLLYEIFVFSSAYIVGGFLRDIIQKKDSRDIDIIVDLSHDKLLSIIKELGIDFILNRHKGIKILFKFGQVDLWSIENNWAFKNNLVKLNEEKKLDSIAKGCFYNYDSLVINLHTFNLNIRNYCSFLEKKELDILQKNPLYKILNPTIEANILRAFYLKKLFDITYSQNTRIYLLSKIAELKDKNLNPILVLIKKKKEYPKYDSILTDIEIKQFILELINDNEIDHQFFIKI